MKTGDFPTFSDWCFGAFSVSSLFLSVTSVSSVAKTIIGHLSESLIYFSEIEPLPVCRRRRPLPSPTVPTTFFLSRLPLIVTGRAV